MSTDYLLTYWSCVTHICVSKLGHCGFRCLSLFRNQAIVWTNAAILSIKPQGTHLSEMSFKIQKFAFKEMHLKISSATWRPFLSRPLSVSADETKPIVIFKLKGENERCRTIHIKGPNVVEVDSVQSLGNTIYNKLSFPFALFSVF